MQKGFFMPKLTSRLTWPFCGTNGESALWIKLLKLLCLIWFSIMSSPGVYRNCIPSCSGEKKVNMVLTFDFLSPWAQNCDSTRNSSWEDNRFWYSVRKRNGFSPLRPKTTTICTLLLKNLTYMTVSHTEQSMLGRKKPTKQKKPKNPKKQNMN